MGEIKRRSANASHASLIGIHAITKGVKKQTNKQYKPKIVSVGVELTGRLVSFRRDPPLGIINSRSYRKALSPPPPSLIRPRTLPAFGEGPPSWTIFYQIFIIKCAHDDETGAHTTGVNSSFGCCTFYHRGSWPSSAPCETESFWLFYLRLLLVGA